MNPKGQGPQQAGAVEDTQGWGDTLRVKEIKTGWRAQETGGPMMSARENAHGRRALLGPRDPQRGHAS